METRKKTKALFLHHSTGRNIWLGKTNKYVNSITGRNSVQDYFRDFNGKHGSDYTISERFFPNSAPYGWKNYPFDYYNIWVKNAGELPFLGEPTLEILTKEYDVIIFKHCYPVSKIQPESGNPDINSEEKTLENYKLQYTALKQKIHEFPDNRFIIWTPAVHVKSMISDDEAKRTYEFYRWMLDEWKEDNDNIRIWDFYMLETEGGLYLKDEYSEGPGNSHPNSSFSARVSPLFSQFVIDVISSEPKN